MANKYGVKEVADVTLWDLVSGSPLLFLDTLKMTTIENKADSSYARGGKGNPKLLGWDFNREATVQMQDALMSTKSISLLTGNNIVTGAATIAKREVLTTVVGAAGKSKVTLATAPMTGSVKAFKIGDLITPIASTVVGSDVSFADTDAGLGIKVEVYYNITSGATAETITISADKFPSYIRLTGDTVVRNAANGNDEAFQIIIHKAKISPNFTLTFQADGDPTVFDMNLDVFKRDQDSDMISMIKY